MDAFDFDELRAWSQEGGALGRSYFNRVAGRRKADRSWVTEADEAIERLLVERIAARYPTHGIIGEEQTHREPGREFVWALDPIDGTASFVAGLPMWGVSIGLLRRGVPYLGVIYLPMLDDCYWAGPDGDAFLNGQPIHVAPARDWESQDWIATPSNAHRRFTIDFVGKTRTLGCTVAEFCYVARGSAIGALISRSAIWDIAAGLTILRAAGGIAVALSGTPIDTTTMLDGRQLAEPVLLGAEPHVANLRAAIAQRGRV
jgi:myo-inositol-1(or 4)-monophosphatase